MSGVRWSGPMINKLFCVAAFLAMVCMPGIASAQSAISGLVTDTSGGILPGVTVEAASDALIEKIRSVVSDGQGRYKIGRASCRERV